MGLLEVLLSVALATSGVNARDCCHLLSKTSGIEVSYPGDESYNATEAAYWSLQESELLPACILHPTTTKEVAKAVSVLSSVDGCEFAIKGQAHSPAAGFANVQGGVTIDMTGMASVDVHADHTVATVGAGASWLQVYQNLDTYGISAVGGRNGLVGVGGLLIGGGISHFSPRRGWACDNVVNYEVVLGNGSVANVNKHSHSDLFKALKGGGNNFGVVTHFDLATFPQGNVSVTKLAHEISELKAVFEAFTNIAASPNFDVDTSLVTGLLYNSTSKGWEITNSAVYAKPIASPPVFKELSSIPSITNSTSILSVSEYADETATPPLNWLFATATFKPSAQLMMDIFDQLNATLGTFNPSGGVVWSIAFEPLAGAMVSGKGGDVLGLDSENQGFVLLLSALWPEDESRDAVETAARTALSGTEFVAKEQGMLQEFQYLNYASPSQTPFESYGENNLKFLRKVREEYDPRGIFTHRVKGGFKL